MTFSSRENIDVRGVLGLQRGGLDIGAKLPGSIRQIGYVVDDLDRALASWVAPGVGPSFVTTRGMPQRVTYRGEPCEVTISLALASRGDLRYFYGTPRQVGTASTPSSELGG